MKKTRISKETTAKRKIELTDRVLKDLNYDGRGIFAGDIRRVLLKLSEADLYTLMVAYHGAKNG